MATAKADLSSVDGQSGPTVIHLGAGKCAGLDGYLSRDLSRLVLVEGDPALASDLKERTRDLPWIRVADSMLAERQGKVVFRRYNLSEANCLRMPTGLMDLFPGLKLIEEKPVQAFGIGEFISELEIDPDQANELVLEIPGEECSFLKVLQRLGQLQLFSRIELTIGRSPLYEGAASADQILNSMREFGFDLIAEDAELDPDRPRLVFQRNKLAIDYKRQRIQIEELTKELRQSNSEIEELRSIESGLRHDIAELDAQCKSLVNDRDVQTSLLEAERSNHVKVAAEAQEHYDQLRQHVVLLEGQLSEKNSELHKQQATLTQISASLDDQRALAIQMQESTEKLTKERDEQAQISKKQKDWIEQLQQQVTKSQKDRDELQQKQNQLNRDLQEVRQRSCELEQQVSTKNAELEKNRKYTEQLKASVDELREVARKEQVEYERVCQERDKQAECAKEQKDEINQISIRLSEKEGELEQKNKEIGALSQQARLDSERLSQEKETSESQESRIAVLEEELRTAKERLLSATEKLAALESERKETAMRQSLLDHEVSRSEAQIELIKDLLLKDVGI